MLLGLFISGFFSVIYVLIIQLTHVYIIALTHFVFMCENDDPNSRHRPGNWERLGFLETRRQPLDVARINHFIGNELAIESTVSAFEDIIN